MEYEMSESAFDDDDDDDGQSPRPHRAKSESPTPISGKNQPIPLVTQEPTANETPTTGDIGVARSTSGDASGEISGRGLGDTGPDFGPEIDGGWFWGDSTVNMADGGRKSVRELRKGDKILCDTKGSTAEVICVLVMPVKKGHISVVDWNNGARVMTQHPIRYPDKASQKKHGDAQYVYNVFLDGAPTIVVNDITCVALGHGVEGEVAHEFWSRSAREQSLRGIGTEQFEEGQVLFPGFSTVGTTCRVCGLRGKSVGKY